MAHISQQSYKHLALFISGAAEIVHHPQVFFNPWRKSVFSVFHLANFRTLLQHIKIILNLESTIYDIHHLSEVYVICKLSKLISSTSLKKEDVI